ncbi:MAG: LemA family protein [Arachnia sp.]
MEIVLGIVIVLVVLVVAVAAWGIGAYNGFVKSRNMIQESWRQVDVELNRRYDLIPNLVETVRGFAAHERNTLEEVTRLRNSAAALAGQSNGAPSEQRAAVEAELSQAVRSMVVSVEAYPEVKSNQNFLQLQQELTDTEDRIAAGRRYYNATVRQYNTKIETIPSNIVAGFAKFEKATYFEVNDPMVRQAPSVNFGEAANVDEAAQPQATSTPQLGAQQPGSAQPQPPFSAPQTAPDTQPSGRYQPPYQG